MTTVTLTEASAQLRELLDEVNDSHDPVHITGETSGAVLMAEDDWRAIQETLHLVSLPGMRESIMEGLSTPLEECSTELAW